MNRDLCSLEHSPGIGSVSEVDVENLGWSRQWYNMTTLFLWPIVRGDSVLESAINVTCILKHTPTVAFGHARSHSFMRSVVYACPHYLVMLVWPSFMLTCVHPCLFVL